MTAQLTAKATVAAGLTLAATVALGNCPRPTAAMAAPATTTIRSATTAGSEVALSTTHTTRLWTRVPGGKNGYADVRHTYTSVGGGYYQGVLSGKLHHYHAPANRYVILQFKVDGANGGRSKQTKTTTTFRKKYGNPPFKKVSVRICLHRAGVPITLHSGLAYCGAWWG
jgi:hypothetical protein